MRKDMAKVVTERPRRGHGIGLHERNQWTATRGKVRAREAERDDDAVPLSAVTHTVRPDFKRDYGDSTYGKSFSDLLNGGKALNLVAPEWRCAYGEARR